MADRWADAGGGITGPIERAVAVTPAAADLADVCRAVYVGGTGSLVVRFAGAPTLDVTLTGVAAGVWHPMRLVRVGAASTATGIVAGY